MITATLARLGLVAKPENAWQVSGWRLAALSLNEFGSCVLLVAIPIVLSIINSSWLYTPIGYLDPWYNVGYFLHYSDPNFLNTSYKIARLSWIIPGFAAYHVFPPLVANYVLHMGCLLVAIVFFFLAVSRLFDSSIAFATAVCFAIFVPFHGSAGWDYQNAPAGAYYIAAFYFLTVAAESTRMRVPIIVAGAAYACAVHATISFVNFAPLLAAHFIVLHRRRFSKLPSWRTLWGAGVWFILGALGVTALLGIVNVAVGRDFLFFKILLQFVIDLVENSQGQAQWWLPWSSGWFLKFPSLSYMASIFASLIVCASSAILGLIARRDSVALSLQLQYVFAAVLWMIWQSLGQTALEPEYFAYPLYPVMFFGLAGLAATWLPTGRGNSTSIVFSLSIAGLAVLSLSVGLFGIKLLEALGQHLELALIVSCVAFAALFAASRGREALLVVAVLAFCTSNTLGVAATGATQHYARGQKCWDGAGDYLALIESHRFVTRFAVNTQDIFVWWPQGETLRDRDGCTLDLSYFAGSMTSFGLQYLASPWPGMPDVDDLPADSFALLYAGRKVAVLSHDQANVQRLMARYARAGKELTLYGQTIIRTSRFAFNLYVLGL